MRIVFIGDVVGEPGMDVVCRAMPLIRKRLDPHLVIANAENATGGLGTSPDHAKDLLDLGCDVLTGGNHTWDRPDYAEFLAANADALRPANLPTGTPGRGYTITRAANGVGVAIINLVGRVFMAPADDPFATAVACLAEIGRSAAVTIVDMHAEATSEKQAMGRFLDGRVTAVLGTHTHVATADAVVFSGGTAYISDVGMTGPHESIIGVEIDALVRRFTTARPQASETAIGRPVLNAVLVEADVASGRATSIRRIRYPDDPRDRGSIGLA